MYIELKCKTRRRKINKIRPFMLRSDLIYFSSSGFTLIELLVAIGIFLVVTAVTLANFPSFSNRLSLNLLAEDITLSVKQAQVFGSSVYGVKTSAGKTFDAVGVHFEAPLLPMAGERVLDYHYVFYADLNKNNAYNGTRANVRSTSVPRGDNLLAVGIACGSPTSSEECLEKYIINGPNKVLAVCPDYITASNASLSAEARIIDCKTRAVSSVDITFVRASLEANFGITQTLGSSPYSTAENVGIILGVPSVSGSIPRGSFQKAVVIWRTGLTSFEQ